jgi:hypothetical protein
MDNIKDENLQRLAKFIAEELISLAKDRYDEDWVETDMKDHAIGELARCVTLQNLYLDREEFEKCAIMKLKIQDIKDTLNIEGDIDFTNLKDDEDDEI